MYENRGDIRAAVESLGLSHLGTARLNDYIDEAVRELMGELLWAWRLQTSGLIEEPPVQITGLGTVESVELLTGSVSHTLEERTYDDLTASDIDLAAAGVPTCWYRDDDEFSDSYGLIGVWPVGGPVRVRHFTTRGWQDGLSAANDDSDRPLIINRQRDMIRLLAVERGLNDDGRADEAVSHRAQYERRLERETEENDRTGVHEGLRRVVADGYY